MKPFYISMLFGSFEIALLWIMLHAVKIRQRFLSFVFLAVKFASYGMASALLMLEYFTFLPICLLGFLCGAALSAVAVFIIKALFKVK